MRAVKSKLRKGAYVMMLSQHESLGGKVLWWSKIGPYGIGSKLPSVTKPVKHYGRYFDRIIKFEDSIFTLCPPKNQLRPSYVLVLEIFQLANHHNPEDVCVGWTAFPMCNEHFGFVNGRLKLPVMRGEHSVNCQHYRKMEEAMSTDLNNWLCNVYIEVRPLPPAVLTRYMDVDDKPFILDYFNKSVKTNAYMSAVSSVLRHGKDVTEEDKQNELLPPSPAREENNMYSLNVDKGLYRRNSRQKAEDDDEEAQRTLVQEKHKKKNIAVFNYSDDGVDDEGHVNDPSSKSRRPNILMSLYRKVVGSTSRPPRVQPAIIAPPASQRPSRRVSSSDEGEGDGEGSVGSPVEGRDPYDKKSALVAFAEIDGPRDDQVDDEGVVVMQEPVETSSPVVAEEQDAPDIPEVFERGYNSDDDFFLDDEETGKLVGIETIESGTARHAIRSYFNKSIIRRSANRQYRPSIQLIIEYQIENNQMDLDWIRKQSARILSSASFHASAGEFCSSDEKNYN